MRLEFLAMNEKVERRRQAIPRSELFGDTTNDIGTALRRPLRDSKQPSPTGLGGKE